MSPSQRSVNDAILDAVNGGLIAIDKNERIIRWNTWMISASGMGLDDVLGKTLPDVFPTVDLRRISPREGGVYIESATVLTRALNKSPLPLRTRSGDRCARYYGFAGRAKACSFVVSSNITM